MSTGRNQQPEARRYSRFKLEVDVTVRSPTLGLIPGMSIEMSETGMSAILPVELPLGETVGVHINLPGGSIDQRAVVRNINAFRHGFEFADHRAARKQINEYCTEVKRWC
ncbi:MAG TPA: PilZ domain-containing protein [Terriglobales bacterium]|nr:PilZ domain-containing protein [Terriglobales bacterium]